MKKSEAEHTEEELDSLGQPNPAREMERKNLEAAKERQEKADKEAEKSEKKG